MKNKFVVDLYHLPIEITLIKRLFLPAGETGFLSVSLQKETIASAMLDFSNSHKEKIIPEAVGTGCFLSQ